MIYRKFLLSGLFLSIFLGITSININEAQATNVTFDFDSLPFAQDWTYISNETPIPETDLFLVSNTKSQADGESEGIGSLFQGTDFLTISSWVIGFCSLVFGLWQFYRTKKLEKEQQEQMLVTIHFANYVGFEHEFIDEICPIIKDTIINRYLVSWHQAGCDLYKLQVRYYLSLLDKFTYNDLKSLFDTPMITYKWQKEYWMSLVSQRKENKRKEPPQDLLTLVNKQVLPSRFDYYKKHKKGASHFCKNIIRAVMMGRWGDREIGGNSIDIYSDGNGNLHFWDAPHKNDKSIRSLTMESDEIKSQLVQEIKKKHPKLTDNEVETMLSDNYFGSFYSQRHFIGNYLIEILKIANYHTFRDFQDCIDYQKIWIKMQNKVITFNDGQKLHVIIDNIT